MRSLLDRWSWPARRFLADRLVGEHAYSRNVVESLTATEIAVLMTAYKPEPMADFVWTPQASGPMTARTYNGRGEQTGYRVFNQDAS